MAMSKKQYVAIAKAVNEIAHTDGMDLPTVTALTSKIADVMQADNPNFDRQRFIAACYQ